VLWFLRSPWATLLFGAMLALMLSRHSLRTFTQVRAGAPTVASGGPEFGLATVIRTAQGLRVVDPASPQTGSGRVVGCAWYAYRRSAGPEAALAVTREAQGIIVSGSISNAEIPQVETLYVAYLQAHPDPYWKRVGKELSATSGTGGVSVESGLRLVFFVQAALFALTGHSLWWVPAAWVWGRERVARVVHPPLTPQEKRWRSLARGECPTCQYSITGLSKHQCPECGEKWHVMELTAWERLR
jgi:hypothetical protein